MKGISKQHRNGLFFCFKIRKKNEGTEKNMKLDRKVMKGIVMITQIGISMLVPIFLCVFIGMKLDNWLHTNFITIIGIILGIVVAYRNIYMMTKQFYAKDKEKEDAQLSYHEQLKRPNNLTKDKN